MITSTMDCVGIPDGKDWSHLGGFSSCTLLVDVMDCSHLDWLTLYSVSKAFVTYCATVWLH